MKPSLVKAQVERIIPLTDSIIHLVLKPEHYVAYQAGQYLNLLWDDQESSYSIANAPLGASYYELHIRHSADNACNQSLLASLKSHRSLTLKLPLGQCSLAALDAQRPILFVAAGTGFAPIHAMIEQLLADADTRAFELFWGARTQSDLYLHEKAQHWQAHVSQFKYHFFLSETQKNNLFSQLLSAHAHDLMQWQFVLSGPFDLIYQMRDQLVARGVSPAFIFSDAFSFE